MQRRQHLAHERRGFSRGQRAEHTGRLANHFVACISPKSLARRIDLQDHTLFVGHRHSLGHVLEDRRLRLEHFPGPLPFRDIVGDTRDAIHLSLLVAHRERSVANPTHRTVGLEDAVFDVVSAGSLVGEGAARHRLTVLGMHGGQPGMRVAIQVLTFAAPDAFVSRADVGHFVFGHVGKPKHFGNVVDDLLETFEGFRQAGGGGLMLFHLRFPLGRALLDQVAQVTGESA